MSIQSSDVVIIGGSIAGLRAAEAIVRHAPSLKITVVSDEPNPAYQRPPLSKIGLADSMDLESLTYPSVATLKDHGVVFSLGNRAESLDTKSQQIHTAQGILGYRALVIATGCEPMIPPLFRGLSDVFSLRRFEDAVALRAAVADPDKTVAVIGAGFIGGEFAATLVKEGRDVTVIDLAEKPLGRFGEAASESYQNLHLQAGVTLHLGKAVVEITEENGRRALLLGDGTKVPADVILLGVGVRPSTGWLQESGLELDQGLVCDASLQAAPGIYAAGDLVRWPNKRFGVSMRIEHWTNAAEQGRVAGLNAANAVLGEPTLEFSNVPYFWSDQHGTRIQFAGYRFGTEEIIEDHSDEGSLFFYRSGQEVTGVLAFERRTQFAKLRAALRKPLSWSDVEAIIGSKATAAVS